MEVNCVATIQMPIAFICFLINRLDFFAPYGASSPLQMLLKYYFASSNHHISQTIKLRPGTLI